MSSSTVIGCFITCLLTEEITSFLFYRFACFSPLRNIFLVSGLLWVTNWTAPISLIRKLWNDIGNATQMVLIIRKLSLNIALFYFEFLQMNSSFILDTEPGVFKTCLDRGALGFHLIIGH